MHLRARNRKFVSFFSILGAVAILVAAGLAIFWPVIAVASYQGLQQVTDQQGIGESADQHLRSGIIIRRLSLLQYYRHSESINRSQMTCGAGCQARVTTALEVIYAPANSSAEGVWHHLKEFVWPTEPEYPVAIRLQDRSVVGRAGDAVAFLEAAGKIEVQLPGVGNLEIERVKPFKSGRTPTSSSIETWSGRLVDGTGTAIVTIDPHANRIAFVIQRKSETISVLRSRNGGEEYELEVIPSAEKENHTGPSDANSSTSTTTEWMDVCDEADSDVEPNEERQASERMIKTLEKLDEAPIEWCKNTPTINPPFGGKRWPSPLQQYRNWPTTDECEFCLIRLHAHHRQTEEHTIAVLPVISSLLLDSSGKNHKIDDALRIAEEVVNSALLRSSVKGQFTFLRPAGRLAFKTSDEERAAITTRLSAMRRAAKIRSETDLSRIWNPYSELDRMRKEAAADLVLLITANMPEAKDGITVGIPATNQLFFSIIHAGEGFRPGSTDSGDNFAINSTLAHELAHALGAHHQSSEVGQRIPPTAHGYELALDGANDLGTLETQNRKRLVRLSDPCGICKGKKLGHQWTADSVAKARREFSRIADLNGTTDSNVKSTPVCETYLASTRIAPKKPPVFERCDALRDSAIIFRFESRKGELADPRDLAACAKVIASELKSRDDDLARDRYAEIRMRPVVIVAGYADQSGTEPGNVAIGWQRARFAASIVQSGLIEHAGKTSSELNYGNSVVTCYYGHTRPLCNESKASGTDKAECRHANRRVEISIAEVPEID